MGTAYLVTYDLNKSGKDYKSLFDEIDKQCTKWVRPLKSVYLVKSDLTAKVLFEKLHEVMDKDDSLLVIEVKNNKHGWLDQSSWDYINKSIF